MNTLISHVYASVVWLPLADGGGLADRVAGQMQTILVAAFFILFIGGLALFVASLIIDSLRPKRWMSFIALLLAAGVAVVISTSSGTGFMDTIGKKVKGSYDILIGN